MFSFTLDIYCTSVRPGRGIPHMWLSLRFLLSFYLLKGFFSSFSFLLLRVKDRGCHTLLKPYETNCGLWIWAIQIKFDWLIDNTRQYNQNVWSFSQNSKWLLTKSVQSEATPSPISSHSIFLYFLGRILTSPTSAAAGPTAWPSAPCTTPTSPHTSPTAASLQRTRWELCPWNAYHRVINGVQLIDSFFFLCRGRTSVWHSKQERLLGSHKPWYASVYFTNTTKHFPAKPHLTCFSDGWKVVFFYKVIWNLCLTDGGGDAESGGPRLAEGAELRGEHVPSLWDVTADRGTDRTRQKETHHVVMTMSPSFLSGNWRNSSVWKTIHLKLQFATCWREIGFCLTCSAGFVRNSNIYDSKPSQPKHVNADVSFSHSGRFLSYLMWLYKRWLRQEWGCIRF